MFKFDFFFFNINAGYELDRYFDFLGVRRSVL
jgi:hypothetical protein